MENLEVNELLEKIAQLEKEKEAYAKYMEYTINKTSESLFTYRNINLETNNFKYLDSYEKLKMYNDVINASSKDKYHKWHCSQRLLKNLISNAKYKEKTEPDIDAEFVVELYKDHSAPFSKKDEATIMRHVKIDQDVYLANLEFFSPYFNTLKKGNPDIKTSSIKLMNEVAGTKRTTVTRQEKLERGWGLLTAYKQYTPQEALEYSRSFKWPEILSNTDHSTDYDALGRHHNFNEDAFDYYANGGILKDICRQNLDSWTYNRIVTAKNSNSLDGYSIKSGFSRILNNLYNSSKHDSAEYNVTLYPFCRLITKDYLIKYVNTADRNELIGTLDHISREIFLTTLLPTKSKPQRIISFINTKTETDVEKEDLFNLLVFIEAIWLFIESSSQLKKVIEEWKHNLNSWNFMYAFKNAINVNNSSLNKDFIECYNIAETGIKEKIGKYYDAIMAPEMWEKRHSLVTTDEFWKSIAEKPDNGYSTLFNFDCCTNVGTSVDLIDPIVWEKMYEKIINN